MSADKLREWVKQRKEIAGKRPQGPFRHVIHGWQDAIEFPANDGKFDYINDVTPAIGRSITDAVNSSEKYAEIVEVLLAALELLVRDVSEYEAFERPCYALDKARDAISKAAAIVGDV